jgi:succinoglycan biosynthesis protein ExoA
MPEVSIIIPCYNEENTIYPLLEAIYQQDYPRSRLEVLIAEGCSEDKTLQKIHLFQTQRPDFSIIIIDNPMHIIPAGLNLALRSTHGEFIIRLDAHCLPYPDYVRRCIDSLKAGLGANVGGRWDIQPGSSSWIARAIAFAASHPFGVGGARYRIGGQPQPVETVPFGAFKRSLIDEIGFFNEELHTNEDYEFNVRIKEKGLVVWFDPLIRSIYYTRSDYLSLAKQYWRYGYWKARMLKRYPMTIRWRQLIPALFVISLAAFSLLSPLVSVALYALFIELGFYLLLISFAGFQATIYARDWKMFPGVIIAIVLMHFTWGISFWWSLLKR